MSSVEALHSPVDAKVPGDMGSRSQSTPRVVPGATVSTEKKSDYKGFVAGVFSGIAKLTGMFFLSFFPWWEEILLETLRTELICVLWCSWASVCDVIIPTVLFYD